MLLHLTIRIAVAVVHYLSPRVSPFSLYPPALPTVADGFRFSPQFTNMYNPRSRAVHIWSQGLNTVLIAALILAVHSYVGEWVWPAVPTATLTPQTTEVVSAHLGHPTMNNLREVHRTVLRFDIVADFRPCFNWNTKQVFAFIRVSYSTKDYQRNELNLWDIRIGGVHEAVINEKGAVEYPLDDVDMALPGTEVTAVMMYQTMFYSGYAPLKQVPNSNVTITLSKNPVIRHVNSVL